MSESTKHKYPQLKERELQEHEKQQIRVLLQQGKQDIYSIAQQFSCSASQVAGIKAHLQK